MSTQAQPMPMSYWPEDFVQGGLLNDTDVEVLESRAVLYDYNGKVHPPVCAVRWVLKPLDGSGAVEQYFSAGKEADFIPSPDGEAILAVLKDSGAAAALYRGSNWFRMTVSLASTGYTKDKMVPNGVPAPLSSFIGLQFHAQRFNTPKVDGKGGAKKDESKRDFEQSTIICNKILRFPWEAKTAAKGSRTAAGSKTNSGASGAAAAASAAPGAAAPGEAVDLDAMAKEFLDGVLAKQPVPGTISFSSDAKSKGYQSYKVTVFQAVGAKVDSDTRKALVSKMCDGAWLADNGYAVLDDSITKME